MAVRFGGSGGGITALTIGVGATTIVGGAANRILFEDSTGTALAQSANLLYDEASGPRLQVGSGSTTSAGFIIGYSGFYSGECGIYPTSRAVDSNTACLYSQNANTFVSCAGGGAVYLRPNGQAKLGVFETAGVGPFIIAGTATTDVNALSATQTWNNAAVAFTGWKYTITDTASAAGALAMQIFGGAAGTTSLFKVSKAGLVDAPAYAVGGTAGLVSFSGAVTNITVVNGIVTAAS